MIVLFVFLAILIIYVIFVLGPAVTMYAKVFTKKDGSFSDKRDIKKTYFAPYEGTIRSGYDFFEGMSKERIEVRAFDEAPLSADYYDNGSDRMMIFMHGYNGSPLSNFAAIARYFYERGVNVLLVYERAHGVSGGKASSLGILEANDVITFTKWAEEKKGITDVFLYGISMGSSSIMYASDRLNDFSKVKGMILDCGFSSPYGQLRKDCVMRHLPYGMLLPIISLLAKALLKIDIHDTVGEHLKKTSVPAFFVHGCLDETVSITDSERNFELTASEKDFYRVENGHHACAWFEGEEKVKKAIMDFVEKFKAKED